jgi:hypothetical protein
VRFAATAALVRGLRTRVWRCIVAAADGTDADGNGASFPLEVAAVWVLFGVVAVEIWVAYSRLPASELYHVSGSGVIGGASRALVFVNFPLALVAIPILLVLLQRLAGHFAKAAALIGIILSAAIFWPGIVKQSDLDARPVNAIAALGVLVALVLTLGAASRLSRPAPPVFQRADLVRVLVAAAVLVLALPWIGADLGLSFNGVPVLGSLYQTGELRAQPHVTALHPAVHHGHHHGMDGALLVFSALLLSRVVPTVPSRRLRGVLGAYLALMLCYGAGNLTNDFWLEQIVKRGWTNWEIPDVTTPKASVAWGVIVLAAAALWGTSVWRGRHASAPPAASPETA